MAKRKTPTKAKRAPRPAPDKPVYLLVTVADARALARGKVPATVRKQAAITARLGI